MTTLFFGQVVNHAPIPQDENVVRRPTAPADAAPKPAEMTEAPEFGSVETDNNPRLGLVTRNVAGDYHPSESADQTLTVEPVDAGTEHNAIVNRQVSSAGNAAHKEATDSYGHGTMPWSVAIEPTIRDGAAFGADYFARDYRPIQEPESSTSGVQPNIAPRDDISSVAAYGNINARDANAAGVTAAMYAQLIGG